MEDSLYDDQLAPPAVSVMVSSPTTDTLDSVALETSPTDDQDLGDHTITAGNQEGPSGQDTGLSPANVTIDLDSSVAPSMSETQVVITADGPSLATAFGGSVDRQGSISSYFASEGAGDNAFDSIGGGSGASKNALQGQDAFNISRVTSSNPVPSLEQNTEQDNKEKEQVVQFESGVERQTSQSDTTQVRRREHKISTSEPETVGFEGVDDVNVEAAVISDLTEKEDEFESFTAGEGSELAQHPGLLERSDSQPQGHASSAGDIGLKMEDPANLVAGLSLHGPSVGATPSVSPLHQPVIPKGTADQPAAEQQGSPFHSVTEVMPSLDSFPSFGEATPGDDVFTASLSVSDLDRRHCAWIPSDATRHTLVTVATSPPGTFCPAPEQLSTPGVLNNEPQGDPVRDLVYRYMGETEAVRRQVLTADAVPQNIDGLRELTASGCLRAAVDLTGRLLTSSGQGESNMGIATQHSPQTLQLWFCRFSLMIKLRLYEMAEAEMRAFQNLDTPDLYFEFYPQTFPGRRGSMVCFAMRLLHADLPHLNGRSQETLDRLYYILAVVRKIMTNLESELCEDGGAAHLSAESRQLSKDLWLERERQVMYKIAGVLLSVRDYQAALAVYNSLMEKDVTKRAELLTGISRIHLQMGNVNKANELHLEVEKLIVKGDNASACLNAMNKGLSAMCINNFSEAYNHFKTAVQLEPDNTCAVNNMAVCSLYLGRLKDALNTLEAAVHGDPGRNLHEGVLFNLCTLYELESSRALHKKQAVLDLVAKHKGDGFPTACLKMA